MKLLFIHSDYIEYEAKEKVKGIAEEIGEERKKGKLDEALTVFMAVEKGDEEEKRIVKKALIEIKDVASKLNTNKIMLYPYAHLSSDLAKPEIAKNVSILLEKALKDSNFQIVRAPFGWYKAFKISCKGHPLSELSREIKIEEKITREEVVEKISSRNIILTKEGKEIPIDLDKIESNEILKKYPLLKKYLISEKLKKKLSKEPPSIKAMQRLELVDYADASDSGHFLLYPKGFLVFSLLKKQADKIARGLGAMQIDTPILYDWNMEDIQEQTKSFHERHYIINTPDKTLVLRFAGDFGLFRMLKNATISYRQLPFKVYEFSKSFRYEQRGELSGLKRLRAFHMPDIHAFSKDIEEGMKQFKEIYESYQKFVEGTKIEYCIAFVVVEEFYKRYKDKITELLKISNKPAVIEILSERKHYWVIKNEINGVDSVGSTTQLCTVQLDVEDAKRYGIMYIDKDGDKKPCIICHCSVGSIERWIYEILEDAQKKEKPYLPFWLAPIQIRLIPLREEFLEDCKKIAEELKGIARVDIDDRDEKIGRKVRDAEREWINMIIVYGDKERESKKLPIRLRSGEILEISKSELKKEAKKLMRDYPFEELSLPIKLSKKIVFRG